MQKITKFCIALTAMCCFMLVGFNAQADWRGKWNATIELDPASGEMGLTIDCKYSLFTKECNQGDIIQIQ